MMFVWSRRRICLLLGLLIISGQVSVQAGPDEAPLKLIARGGLVLDELPLWEAACDDPSDWNVYTYLKLTVQVENLRNAARIEGVILHPYGEGPFDVILGGSPLIQSAEVVVEGERVVFSVELAAPSALQSLILFTAKPDMCVDRNGGRIWGGEAYPVPVEWIDATVTDPTGALAEASTHTDPVLISNDVVKPFQVLLQGFTAPAIALCLVELNGRELYPPRELAPIDFGPSGWYGFGGSEGSNVVGIPGLPMVFEVELIDGQSYRLPAKENSPIVLTPTSAVAHWEHY